MRYNIINLNRKLILISAFILGFIDYQYGQNLKAPKIDSTKVLNLNEVIITAPRNDIPLKEMPAATSIVTEEQINNTKTIAADEVMKFVPGVKIDNGTDGERVHIYIRGQGILSETGFRGIQLLIDGISINDPGGYAPDLYDVDWETVKRVEVFKGLAASIYGGSGDGGVINIITKDGGDKPAEGMFYGSYGSDGFFKTLGQVDGTDGDVNYRITYSHNQGNGYRIHQAFLGDNFSEKLNWSPSEKVKITQLLTYTNYFNQNSEGMNLYRIDNFGYTAANPDAVPYNEFHKTQRLTGATILNYDFAKNQNLQLKGFFRINNYRETSNGGDDYKPFVNPGFSAQYNLQHGSENFMNHVSLGADFESETLNEHDFAVPGEGQIDHNRVDSHFGEECFDLNSLNISQIIKQRSLGIFFIDKFDIYKKLFATLNLRYDNVQNQLTNILNDSLSGSRNFNKITYRFGLAYDLLKSLNIYANFGTGFLVPTNDELYNNPNQYGGFNQTIKPSTSQGGELGLRGNVGNKFNFDITGFDITTKNGFYRYGILGRGNNTAFFGNKNENCWGAELYLSYSPVNSFKIQVAYTYSHFQYASHDTVSAHWMPECPQHMLDAEVSYRFLKNFTLALSTELQSRWKLQADDSIYDYYNENGIKRSSWVKGFNIYNVNLSYNWKLGNLKGVLSLYAKNIFDEHYFGFTEPNNWDPKYAYNSFQPAPGREFFASVKFNF